MILKLSYKGQTHLYNKVLTMLSLESFVQKAFRQIPKAFTFIYQSENGEMTYIESDQDLIGLKYCCSAKNNFIVKLVILRSNKLEEQEMESALSEIVRVNMLQINQNVIEDLEQEAIQEEVKTYLKTTYNKVSSDLAKAEEAMIHEEVGDYLSTMYNVTSAKLAKADQVQNVILKKPTSMRVVRFSPEKPKIVNSSKSIEQIIDAKILKLVPSLVDKIYSKIEAKMEKQCRECIKRELALERAIDQQISRKMDSSFTLLEEENPEY